MPAQPSSSNEYEWRLSLAEIMLESYSRISMRGQALTAEHFVEARRSLNLALASWANKGVNLWTVDFFTLHLAEGVRTYPLPVETVSILDLYITTADDDGNETDRILTPIPRTDYAAMPNKAQDGFPSVYWFQRDRTPEITFWPVPNDGGPYVCKFWRLRQIQDANPEMGEVPDVPNRFTDPLICDLTARLAEKYKADQHAIKVQLFKAAWSEASAEDTERTPVSMRGDTSRYWRV